MIGRMRRPPSKLVQRLVSASEEVLRPDPALRLEDVATLIGSSRATLYYHFLWPRRPGRVPTGRASARRRRDNRARRHTHRVTSRPAALSDNRARRVPRGASRSMRRAALLRGSRRTTRNPDGRQGRAPRHATSKAPDEGAATDQFTISDSRDAANAILGAALIATLTRWEDGRDTQDPEFQQALTDQLVRSVARA